MQKESYCIVEVVSETLTYILMSLCAACTGYNTLSVIQFIFLVHIKPDMLHAHIFLKFILEIGCAFFSAKIPEICCHSNFTEFTNST